MREDTSPVSLWLLDVGSTEIKLCRAAPDGSVTAPVRAARAGAAEAGAAEEDAVREGAVQEGTTRESRPAGEQAAALLDAHGYRPGTDRLRVCSSAGGTTTVGLLGLTGRYSLRAAAAAVLTAGVEVRYTRTLDQADDRRQPPVDALVLVGGVDGTDHRRLTAALRRLRPERYPCRTTIWAGAEDAEHALCQVRTGNVLDTELRPRPGPLRETLAGIQRAGLADAGALAGLRDAGALAGLAAVVPTPEAVAEGVRALAARTGPLLVVDVGGRTTEVHHADGEGAVTSRVLTGLGVAGARRALTARLAGTPWLGEVVDALGPTDRRSRYLRLRAGDDEALSDRDAALACLFLALRESEPLSAVSFLPTGGAMAGLTPDRLAAVVEAACGTRPTVLPSAPLWAHGLLSLRQPGAG